VSIKRLRSRFSEICLEWQSGQAVVIMALTLVVLVAFVGLATDGGHAFVDRRALQSGSDVSTEAGSTLLGFNFHNPPTPKTDSDVLAAIKAQVNSSLSSGNQQANFPGTSAQCDPGAVADGTNIGQIANSLTASCAYYVDGSDQTSTTTQKKLLLWPSGFANAGHPVQVGQLSSPVLNLLECPFAVAGWGVHCVDGTSVVAYYTHPTYFMGALGVHSAAERAVATSIFAPVTTLTGGFAHYAVWAFCTANDPVNNPGDSPKDVDTAHPDNPVDADELPTAVDPAGSTEQEVDKDDIVILRDPGWSSLAPTCNPANTNSSNFKGWFHDPVPATPASGSIPPAPAFGSIACGPSPNPAKTTFKELDYFCAKGGTSAGLEAPDIQLLQNAWDSCVAHTASPCTPVLLPVIDYLDEQTGSSFVFHIKSWVAGYPTQDPSTYTSSTTVKVKVVDLVPQRGSWCPTLPCVTPPSSAPVSINLVQ